MRSKEFVIGKLVIRCNWIIAACLAVAVAGLVRLGIWQLERAEEEVELHESFQEMRNSAPTAIENVPLSERRYDAIQLQNRQVSLQGRYLNDRSIFLIYQTYEEQLGFEVVTPFKLAERDETVLVSRGWMAASSYEELKEKLTPVTGEQRILGQIHVPREAQMETDTISEVQWPLLVRHLNVDELQPYFSSPLFPYTVRLNQGEAGVLVRHWPEVQVDTGRHFSYALQWFAMAITLVIVSLIASSNLPALVRRRLKPI